jgi:ribosomal protein S12 methylthiotransferase accessory factor
LRRPPDQREIEPPFPLSTGSAAGISWEAAALHGMLELIERDAASLWWRGGHRGGSIPPQHEARIMAEALLARLRQNATGRRSWLLDITTDIGVPCVAAVSCSANGFGFACGLAARPTLKAAARSAILEMCQLELALAVVEAKCRESGQAALNKRDQGHRRRATMIDADRCPLLQPMPEPKQHLAIDSTDPSAVLQLIVDRLGQFGIETFGLNLTRVQFTVPVARVIAPGLQPEPSEIITPRLADMITQTGGGMQYTGGVALI